MLTKYGGGITIDFPFNGVCLVMWLTFNKLKCMNFLHSQDTLTQQCDTLLSFRLLQQLKDVEKNLILLRNVRTPINLLLSFYYLLVW